MFTERDLWAMFYCVARIKRSSAADAIAEADAVMTTRRPMPTPVIAVDATTPIGPLTLERIERQALIDAATACGGCKAKMAVMLGVSRRALYRNLVRHHLHQEMKRAS